MQNTNLRAEFEFFPEYLLDDSQQLPEALVEYSNTAFFDFAAEAVILHEPMQGEFEMSFTWFAPYGEANADVYSSLFIGEPVEILSSITFKVNGSYSLYSAAQIELDARIPSEITISAPIDIESVVSVPVNTENSMTYTWNVPYGEADRDLFSEAFIGKMSEIESSVSFQVDGFKEFRSTADIEIDEQIDASAFLSIPTELYSEVQFPIRTDVSMSYTWNVPYGESLHDFSSSAIILINNDDFSGTAHISVSVYKEWRSEATIENWIDFVNIFEILYTEDIVMSMETPVSMITDMRFSWNVPFGEDTLDFGGKAFIGKPKELFSSFIPQVKGNKDLGSTVSIEWEESLTSSVTFPYIQDVYMVAGIGDKVNLFLDYSIVQIPMQLLQVFPVQDAYTQASRPTYNAGDKATVILSPKTETTRAYFKFDLRSIQTKLSQNCRAERIVLQLSVPYGSDTTLSFYKYTDRWSEYGITWNNQGTYESLDFEWSGKAEHGLLEVDITDFILEKIASGDTTWSFYLKSSAELYVSSKESISPPAICLFYKDMDWRGYLGSYDFGGTVNLVDTPYIDSFAVIHQNKNIESEIEILPLVAEMDSSVSIFWKTVLDSAVDLEHKGADISGDMFLYDPDSVYDVYPAGPGLPAVTEIVQIPNDINSSAEIVPYVLMEMTAFLGTPSDVESALNISFMSWVNSTAKIAVPKDVKSVAEIWYKTDLEDSAHILEDTFLRYPDGNEFEGDTHIATKMIISSVDIVQISDMHASAKLIKGSETFFDISAEIIPLETYIEDTVHLDKIFTPADEELPYVTGNVHIATKMISSELNISLFNDHLKNIAHIKSPRQYLSDDSGKDYLAGHVEIEAIPYDRIGKVTIMQHIDDPWFSVEIELLHTDAESAVHIMQDKILQYPDGTEFSGTADITSKDILSSVTVLTWDDSFEGYVSIPYDSSVESQAYIATKDILSELNISIVEEVESELYVLYTEDVFSKVHISSKDVLGNAKIFYKTDVFNTAHIQRSDGIILESGAYIAGVDTLGHGIIQQKGFSDTFSETFVLANEYLYSSLDIVKEEFILSSFESVYHDEREFSGHLIIQQDDISDATFTVFLDDSEHNWVNSVSHILLNDNHDIESSAWVPINKDLYGSFFVPINSDLNSDTIIPINVDLGSKLEILKNLDMDSSFQVPMSSDLQSTMGVGDRTVLQLDMTLLQQPVYALKQSIVKDSFTAASRPYANFGDYSYLEVNEDGKARTFFTVKLDNLNQIENREWIKGVYFTVSLSGSLPDTESLSFIIREQFASWNEYGITWANQPIEGDVVEGITWNITDTEIRFDFTNFILQYLEDLDTGDRWSPLFSFEVESNEQIYIRSRESSSPPRFEILYKDWNWTGYMDKTDLGGTVHVEGSAYDDTYMSAALASWIGFDITVDIEHYGKYIDSSANLVGNLDNSSSAEFEHKIYEGLYGSVIIPDHDLRGNAYIAVKDILSSAQVHIYEDLHSQFSYAQLGVIDPALEGWAHMPWADVNSSADILYGGTEDIYSSSEIVYGDVLEASGAVEIKPLVYDLPMGADIWQQRYTEGSVFIIPWDWELVGSVLLSPSVYIDSDVYIGIPYETEASAYIAGSDIFGTSDILIHQDIPSSVSIHWFLDVQSQGHIRTSQIPSQAWIPINEDLASVIHVTISQETDAAATIVYRSGTKDLYQSAEIFYHEDIEGELFTYPDATVSGIAGIGAYSDVTGISSSVFIESELDLESSFIQPPDTDFRASVFIGRPYDFESSADISIEKYIDGSFYLHAPKDILSNVYIGIPYETIAVVTIPYTEDIEASADFYPVPWLFGSGTIEYKTELDSTVELDLLNQYINGFAHIMQRDIHDMLAHTLIKVPAIFGIELDTTPPEHYKVWVNTATWKPTSPFVYVYIDFEPEEDPSDYEVNLQGYGWKLTLVQPSPDEWYPYQQAYRLRTDDFGPFYLEVRIRDDVWNKTPDIHRFRYFFPQDSGNYTDSFYLTLDTTAPVAAVIINDGSGEIYDPLLHFQFKGVSQDCAEFKIWGDFSSRTGLAATYEGAVWMPFITDFIAYATPELGLKNYHVAFRDDVWNERVYDVQVEFKPKTVDNEDISYSKEETGILIDITDLLRPKEKTATIHPIFDDGISKGVFNKHFTSFDFGLASHATKNGIPVKDDGYSVSTVLSFGSAYFDTGYSVGDFLQAETKVSDTDTYGEDTQTISPRGIDTAYGFSYNLAIETNAQDFADSADFYVYTETFHKVLYTGKEFESTTIPSEDTGYADDRYLEVETVEFDISYGWDFGTSDTLPVLETVIATESIAELLPAWEHGYTFDQVTSTETAPSEDVSFGYEEWSVVIPTLYTPVPQESFSILLPAKEGGYSWDAVTSVENYPSRDVSFGYEEWSAVLPEQYSPAVYVCIATDIPAYDAGYTFESHISTETTAADIGYGFDFYVYTEAYQHITYTGIDLQAVTLPNKDTGYSVEFFGPSEVVPSAEFGYSADFYVQTETFPFEHLTGKDTAALVLPAADYAYGYSGNPNILTWAEDTGYSFSDLIQTEILYRHKLFGKDDSAVLLPATDVVYSTDSYAVVNTSAEDTGYTWENVLPIYMPIHKTISAKLFLALHIPAEDTVYAETEGIYTGIATSMDYGYIEEEILPIYTPIYKKYIGQDILTTGIPTEDSGSASAFLIPVLDETETGIYRDWMSERGFVVPEKGKINTSFTGGIPATDIGTGEESSLYITTPTADSGKTRDYTIKSFNTFDFTEGSDLFDIRFSLEDFAGSIESSVILPSYFEVGKYELSIRYGSFYLNLHEETIGCEAILRYSAFDTPARFNLVTLNPGDPGYPLEWIGPNDPRYPTITVESGHPRYPRKRIPNPEYGKDILPGDPDYPANGDGNPIKYVLSQTKEAVKTVPLRVHLDTATDYLSISLSEYMTLPEGFYTTNPSGGKFTGDFVGKGPGLTYPYVSQESEVHVTYSKGIKGASWSDYYNRDITIYRISIETNPVYDTYRSTHTWVDAATGPVTLPDGPPPNYTDKIRVPAGTAPIDVVRTGDFIEGVFSQDIWFDPGCVIGPFSFMADGTPEERYVYEKVVKEFPSNQDIRLVYFGDQDYTWDTSFTEVYASVELPKYNDSVDILQAHSFRDYLEGCEAFLVYSQFDAPPRDVIVTLYPEDTDYPKVWIGPEDSRYPRTPVGTKDPRFPKIPVGPTSPYYPKVPVGPESEYYEYIWVSPSSPYYPQIPVGTLSPYYPKVSVKNPAYGPDILPTDSDYPESGDGSPIPATFEEYAVLKEQGKKLTPAYTTTFGTLQTMYWHDRDNTAKETPGPSLKPGTYTIYCTYPDNAIVQVHVSGIGYVARWTKSNAYEDATFTVTSAAKVTYYTSGTTASGIKEIYVYLKGTYVSKVIDNPEYLKVRPKTIQIPDPKYNGEIVRVPDPKYGGEDVRIPDPKYNGEDILIPDPKYKGAKVLVPDPKYNGIYIALDGPGPNYSDPVQVPAGTEPIVVHKMGPFVDGLFTQKVWFNPGCVEDPFHFMQYGTPEERYLYEDIISGRQVVSDLNLVYNGETGYSDTDYGYIDIRRTDTVDALGEVLNFYKDDYRYDFSDGCTAILIHDDLTKLPNILPFDIGAVDGLINEYSMYFNTECVLNPFKELLEISPDPQDQFWYALLTERFNLQKTRITFSTWGDAQPYTVETAQMLLPEEDSGKVSDYKKWNLKQDVLKLDDTAFSCEPVLRYELKLFSSFERPWVTGVNPFYGKDMRTEDEDYPYAPTNPHYGEIIPVRQWKQVSVSTLSTFNEEDGNPTPVWGRSLAPGKYRITVKSLSYLDFYSTLKVTSATRSRILGEDGEWVYSTSTYYRTKNFSFVFTVPSAEDIPNPAGLGNPAENDVTLTIETDYSFYNLSPEDAPRCAYSVKLESYDLNKAYTRKKTIRYQALRPVEVYEDIQYIDLYFNIGCDLNALKEEISKIPEHDFIESAIKDSGSTSALLKALIAGNYGYGYDTYKDTEIPAAETVRYEETFIKSSADFKVTEDTSVCETVFYVSAFDSAYNHFTFDNDYRTFTRGEYAQQAEIEFYFGSTCPFVNISPDLYDDPMQKHILLYEVQNLQNIPVHMMWTGDAESSGYDRYVHINLYTEEKAEVDIFKKIDAAIRVKEYPKVTVLPVISLPTQDISTATEQAMVHLELPGINLTGKEAVPVREFIVPVHPEITVSPAIRLYTQDFGTGEDIYTSVLNDLTADIKGKDSLPVFERLMQHYAYPSAYLYFDLPLFDYADSREEAIPQLDFGAWMTAKDYIDRTLRIFVEDRGFYKVSDMRVFSALTESGIAFADSIITLAFEVTGKAYESAGITAHLHLFDDGSDCEYIQIAMYNYPLAYYNCKPGVKVPAIPPQWKDSAKVDTAELYEASSCDDDPPGGWTPVFLRPYIPGHPTKEPPEPGLKIWKVDAKTGRPMKDWVYMITDMYGRTISPPEAAEGTEDYYKPVENPLWGQDIKPGDPDYPFNANPAAGPEGEEQPSRGGDIISYYHAREDHSQNVFYREEWFDAASGKYYFDWTFHSDHIPDEPIRFETTAGRRFEMETIEKTFEIWDAEESELLYTETQTFKYREPDEDPEESFTKDFLSPVLNPVYKVHTVYTTAPGYTDEDCFYSHAHKDMLSILEENPEYAEFRNQWNYEVLGGEEPPETEPETLESFTNLNDWDYNDELGDWYEPELPPEEEEPEEEPVRLWKTNKFGYIHLYLARGIYTITECEMKDGFFAVTPMQQEVEIIDTYADTNVTFLNDREPDVPEPPEPKPEPNLPDPGWEEARKGRSFRLYIIKDSVNDEYPNPSEGPSFDKVTITLKNLTRSSGGTQTASPNTGKYWGVIEGIPVTPLSQNSEIWAKVCNNCQHEYLGYAWADIGYWFNETYWDDVIQVSVTETIEKPWKKTEQSYKTVTLNVEDEEAYVILVNDVEFDEDKEDEEKEPKIPDIPDPTEIPDPPYIEPHPDPNPPPKPDPAPVVPKPDWPKPPVYRHAYMTLVKYEDNFYFRHLVQKVVFRVTNLSTGEYIDFSPTNCLDSHSKYSGYTYSAQLVFDRWYNPDQDVQIRLEELTAAPYFYPTKKVEYYTIKSSSNSAFNLRVKNAPIVPEVFSFTIIKKGYPKVDYIWLDNRKTCTYKRAMPSSVFRVAVYDPNPYLKRKPSFFISGITYASIRNWKKYDYEFMPHDTKLYEQKMFCAIKHEKLCFKIETHHSQDLRYYRCRWFRWNIGYTPASFSSSGVYELQEGKDYFLGCEANMHYSITLDPPERAMNYGVLVQRIEPGTSRVTDQYTYTWAVYTEDDPEAGFIGTKETEETPGWHAPGDAKASPAYIENYIDVNPSWHYAPGDKWPKTKYYWWSTLLVMNGGTRPWLRRNIVSPSISPEWPWDNFNLIPLFIKTISCGATSGPTSFNGEYYEYFDEIDVIISEITVPSGFEAFDADVPGEIYEIEKVTDAAVSSPEWVRGNPYPHRFEKIDRGVAGLVHLRRKDGGMNLVVRDKMLPAIHFIFRIIKKSSNPEYDIKKLTGAVFNLLIMNDPELQDNFAAYPHKYITLKPVYNPDTKQVEAEVDIGNYFRYKAKACCDTTVMPTLDVALGEVYAPAGHTFFLPETKDSVKPELLYPARPTDWMSCLTPITLNYADGSYTVEIVDPEGSYYTPVTIVKKSSDPSYDPKKMTGSVFDIEITAGGHTLGYDPDDKENWPEPRHKYVYPKYTAGSGCDWPTATVDLQEYFINRSGLCARVAPYIDITITEITAPKGHFLAELIDYPAHVDVDKKYILDRHTIGTFRVYLRDKKSYTFTDMPMEFPLIINKYTNKAVPDSKEMRKAKVSYGRMADKAKYTSIGPSTHSVISFGDDEYGVCQDIGGYFNQDHDMITLTAQETEPAENHFYVSELQDRKIPRGYTGPYRSGTKWPLEYAMGGQELFAKNVYLDMELYAIKLADPELNIDSEEYEKEVKKLNNTQIYVYNMSEPERFPKPVILRTKDDYLPESSHKFSFAKMNLSSWFWPETVDDQLRMEHYDSINIRVVEVYAPAGYMPAVQDIQDKIVYYKEGEKIAVTFRNEPRKVPDGSEAWQPCETCAPDCEVLRPEFYHDDIRATDIDNNIYPFWEQWRSYYEDENKGKPNPWKLSEDQMHEFLNERVWPYKTDHRISRWLDGVYYEKELEETEDMEIIVPLNSTKKGYLACTFDFTDRPSELEVWYNGYCVRRTEDQVKADEGRIDYTFIQGTGKFLFTINDTLGETSADAGVKADGQMTADDPDYAVVKVRTYHDFAPGSPIKLGDFDYPYVIGNNQYGQEVLPSISLPDGYSEKFHDSMVFRKPDSQPYYDRYYEFELPANISFAVTIYQKQGGRANVWVQQLYPISEAQANEFNEKYNAYKELAEVSRTNALTEYNQAIAKAVTQEEEDAALAAYQVKLKAADGIIPSEYEDLSKGIWWRNLPGASHTGLGQPLVLNVTPLKFGCTKFRVYIRNQNHFEDEAMHWSTLDSIVYSIHVTIAGGTYRNPDYTREPSVKIGNAPWKLKINSLIGSVPNPAWKRNEFAFNSVFDELYLPEECWEAAPGFKHCLDEFGRPQPCYIEYPPGGELKKGKNINLKEYMRYRSGMVTNLFAEDNGITQTHYFFAKALWMELFDIKLRLLDGFVFKFYEGFNFRTSGFGTRIYEDLALQWKEGFGLRMLDHGLKMELRDVHIRFAEDMYRFQFNTKTFYWNTAEPFNLKIPVDFPEFRENLFTDWFVPPLRLKLSDTGEIQEHVEIVQPVILSDEGSLDTETAFVVGRELKISATSPDINKNGLAFVENINFIITTKSYEAGKLEVWDETRTWKKTVTMPAETADTTISRPFTKGQHTLYARAIVAYGDPEETELPFRIVDAMIIEVERITPADGTTVKQAEVKFKIKVTSEVVGKLHVSDYMTRSWNEYFDVPEGTSELIVSNRFTDGPHMLMVQGRDADNLAVPVNVIESFTVDTAAGNKKIESSETYVETPEVIVSGAPSMIMGYKAEVVFKDGHTTQSKYPKEHDSLCVEGKTLEGTWETIFEVWTKASVVVSTEPNTLVKTDIWKSHLTPTTNTYEKANRLGTSFIPGKYTQLRFTYSSPHPSCMRTATSSLVYDITYDYEQLKSSDLDAIFKDFD